MSRSVGSMFRSIVIGVIDWPETRGQIATDSPMMTKQDFLIVSFIAISPRRKLPVVGDRNISSKRTAYAFHAHHQLRESAKNNNPNQDRQDLSDNSPLHTSPYCKPGTAIAIRDSNEPRKKGSSTRLLKNELQPRAGNNREICYCSRGPNKLDVAG